MTPKEKDRLEIVKEVCSLQDCTLQEIYNFVKTGEAVTICLRVKELRKPSIIKASWK